MTEPVQYQFADDGRFPNSRLPLLVYAAAVPPDPAAVERWFAGHGWSNSWRNGVFPYHHYHSIAHEVLGIAAGSVQVLFGGPGGRELPLQAGDVVVIPAGVAHCNMGHSGDLLVIGAYPGGGDCDVLRGEPGEYDRARRAIAALPVPDADPVVGTKGGVPRLWAGLLNSRL